VDLTPTCLTADANPEISVSGYLGLGANAQQDVVECGSTAATAAAKFFQQLRRTCPVIQRDTAIMK
jgi:hypothetical protein